ncbi:MAG: UDP-N-acetylglucosamine 1-carboxyvinyltransferase [Armatimonadetes bacterium]|nr:MAG: UDP-N-acetylglucosamine 1-carboxyvinyltransferase [Armatimonadota bacterium]
MEILRIEGGRPLHGSLRVPGSKNASLAILSSVVLAQDPVVLHNVPNVRDTRVMSDLLELFGARVEWNGDSISIDCSEIHPAKLDPEVARQIRTSFYLLGPLLARLGHAAIPAPGGCRIGARPVDFHLNGLGRLGAVIDLDMGEYVGRTDGLKGADLYLDFPSAGATQHLMATATMAEGVTVIHNGAIEPEVVVLAEFLNNLGARIEGAGTGIITVTGVSRLHGRPFHIPSDRLQAGTYMLAGAITRGEVTVNGILPESQSALTSKLKESGAKVVEGNDWIRVSSDRRLDAINVKTMPYPGFPTDMQQPMAAVLTLADGVSVVEETIYESRIGHVPELNRMGAKIRLEGRSAVITGVEHLKGANLEASDLRAGAALSLAALAAEGESYIRNVHFIDRGYQDFESQLRSLGAVIERIPASESPILEHSEVRP